MPEAALRHEPAAAGHQRAGSPGGTSAPNKDHSLTGSDIPHRECHIQPDWLLIYYQTDTELYLYRTGTHADLFGL